MVPPFFFASIAMPAILVGFAWAYWPSLYFTAPVFFPVAGYVQNQTILLLSAIFWFVAIGGGFAYLSRSQSLLKAALIYVVIVAASSAAGHTAFLLIGYHYGIETP